MKLSVRAYRRTREAGPVPMYVCTDSFEFAFIFFIGGHADLTLKSRVKFNPCDFREKCHSAVNGLHPLVIYGTVIPLCGQMNKFTVSMEVIQNSEVDNGLLRLELHDNKSERKSQPVKSSSYRETALRHKEQNSLESEGKE